MTHENITGRDDYIVLKALAYAICFIDSLPPERREVSDRDDMVAIVLARCPNPEALRGLASEIKRHTGRTPDFTDWKNEQDENL